MRALHALVPLVALAMAPSVSAHPHVWLEAGTGFRLENGRIVAVEILLRFDALTSATLAADFDRDRDGRFDPVETARLEQEVLGALAELDWLCRLRIGGRSARLEPPRAFRAELADGIVSFRFERALVTPADPRDGPVALTLVDPSWYVDVTLDAERPAWLEEPVPQGCALDFQADTSLAGLATPAPPIAALLVCTGGS